MNLIKPRNSLIKSAELFAGGGGLALGAALSGFDSQMALEYNKNSCETLRLNSASLSSLNDHVVEMDVRDFNPSSLKIDFLLGGPPCQPFSIGGKKAGYNDSRDMFRDYLRILHIAKPKAFLIENVRGLTTKRFSEYLEWIHLSLEFADVAAGFNDFDLEKQLIILRKLKSGSSSSSYLVKSRLLNAVDFGVPQFRERFFLVGFRSDLNSTWEWPSSTHSAEALFLSKFQTGEYFERHNLKRPFNDDATRLKIEKIKMHPSSKLQPHVTIRDALYGLPNPIVGKEDKKFKNHIGIPGAKIYPGHTGSYIDDPSKTIKAGVHGCPGGENMIRFEDDTVRYFSVREAARIQTFPDNYIFSGARSEAMRQIGNAVPVKLASAICSSIYRELNISSEIPIAKKRTKINQQQTQLEFVIG